MKPVPFDYYAPTSVAEALDDLHKLGYDGKILAGGQSLIPAMNFRMARPAALVDLNKISELAYIRPGDDGGVVIGAMTRDSVVEKDPEVCRRFPIMAEVMGYIAHTQIRNRGTFGGAIAHADPAAQLPALMVALQANIHIARQGSDRWVPIGEFFMGPFMTVIEPEEMLTEVSIPPLAPMTAASYQQVSRQRGGYAQAATICVVTLDANRNCKDVRLVLFSVGETPILSKIASGTLVGKPFSEDLIDKVAAEVAQKEVDPGSDLHGTAEYRRELVKVLSRRALVEAFQRVK